MNEVRFDDHRRLPACSGWDMDGGAASGALPHCVFGVDPMVSSSFPPLAISACENQGLFHGLPFIVADWIKMFLSELFFAVISNVLPLPMCIVTCRKIGLPRM